MCVCVCFCVIMCVHGLTSSYSDNEDVDLEKDFEQNELNSAVYLISIAMQISNFAVNYKASQFIEISSYGIYILTPVANCCIAIII